MVALAVCSLVFLLISSATASLEGDTCNNAVGERGTGTCIPAEECAPVMEVVQRDNRVMTPKTLRTLQAAHCGFRRHEPLLCCPNGTFSVPTISRPWPSYAAEKNDTDSNSTMDEAIMREKPVGGVEVHLNDPKLQLLPLDSCGVIVSDRKYLGANTMQLTDACPSLARLTYTTSGRPTEQVRCGGSLISARYVLTAAHCVSGFPPSTKLSGVILGDFDLATNPDCDNLGPYRVCRPNYERYGVQKVIVHPDYHGPSNKNDIALIRLNRPANLSTELELIAVCLPLGNLQFKNHTLLQHITTSGWGTLENGTAQYRKRLYGTVFVKNNSSVCGRGFDPNIHYCAVGRTQVDGILTDSGGPLTSIDTFETDPRPLMFQIGVETMQNVSQVPKGNPNATIPRVYTKIGPYLSWIIHSLVP